LSRRSIFRPTGKAHIKGYSMPMAFRGGLRQARRLKNLIRSGDAANRRRSWHEAEAAYRAALTLNASLKHIWVQYGHAVKEQGRLDAAEQAYRHSLGLDAGLADTHLQLGHVLKAQGKIEDAVDSYVTAYRLDPALPDPNIELRALGLEMPAVVARTTAFAIDPEFIEAVYGTSAEPADAGLSKGGASFAGTGADGGYVSREQALSTHGLPAHILDIFDFRYYFYANPSVQDAVGKPNPHRCLLHFCACGVSDVLQCNTDILFDVEFYCATYLRYRLGASNAYWHWLSVGLDKRWHPSKGKWLKEQLGFDAVAPDSFDFELCRTFFYANDADETWADLFGRFINADVLCSGPHLPVTPETAGFFTVIAEGLARGGKDDAAASIYQRVLLSVPHHRKALLNYADYLMSKQLFLQAATIYAGIIERDLPSACCFLQQATCYEELGDLRKALTCLHSGIDRFPGEPRLRQRFDALADQILTRAWPLALAIGKLDRAGEAQCHIEEACKFVSSKMAVTERLPHKPIRSVAIVGNLDMPQCSFYRIEQKIEHLSAAGITVFVYNFHNQVNDFIEEIYKYEAVIFYRVPATAPVLTAIMKSAEMGLVTFYEIDDLIFMGDDYPGTFESFLGQITIEEYVGLKLAAPMYRHAMSLCDYGIAPTTALASEVAKIVASRRAFVHRNAFGRKHERFSMSPPVPRAGDRVTIFYGSGTKSHKEDFRDLVEPALVEIVRRHGRLVHIVLAGYTVMSEALESIRGNLTILDPIWDIEEYWAIFRCADINIAVLKKTSMTDSKSEIKWIEAAVFGIPSVVSGTDTHEEVIEPGVTGFICNTTEEWVAALDLLVRDEALRRCVGLAARQRVRKAYNIPRMGRNLASIFAQTVPVPQSPPRPTIVIANVFYPPQAIGGATRIVNDNVRHLAEAYADDFEIEVFTTAEGTKQNYGISCYVRDGVRVTAVQLSVSQIEQADLDDDRMEELFAEYLDRVNPALIHFHCIQGLTSSVVSAALARGIPYLITAHDGWWISGEQFIVNEADEQVLYDYSDPLATAVKWGAPAYRRVMRLKEILFGARQVLSVSEKFADLYRRCGVPNVITIANGIADIDVRARTTSRDGRVRLGFLGGIEYLKGFDVIRYALLSRKFEHLRLTVIEFGLQPGTSRQEVWNTTPVEFLPKVPEDRVAELYASIDVVLAPSVCVESFGLITREALHCGCWVVASARGSIGDCVTHGENGYVIDVADATELISVLTLIDGSPHRYLQRPPEARPGQRRSREQADELAQLYKSIVASQSPTAAAAPSVDPSVVGTAVFGRADLG
jgi:glycosyltransferase involved in cell wall biosynthesis/tetratricopeptide (TPR) repeat protein